MILGENIMDKLDLLYERVLNSNVIQFDEFFCFKFYVNYKSDILFINDEENIGDEIFVKCRKLSYDSWCFLGNIEDLYEKEIMLLIFSLYETNICDIYLKNNIISIESLKSFLNLNSNIIKHITEKINRFYYDEKEEYYKYEISKDFTRLYNSEKGIILEHKEVGDYLSLTAFWEKLGLNYFDLKKLPYDLYKKLSLMMSLETEAKNNMIRDASNKAKAPKNPNRRGR